MRGVLPEPGFRGKAGGTNVEQMRSGCLTEDFAIRDLNRAECSAAFHPASDAPSNQSTRSLSAEAGRDKRSDYSPMIFTNTRLRRRPSNSP
jgi:hypothetical protein